ncbi:MAG TPA: adenine phosphoribosyltransferase [Phycisphaerae bacterium]|nr:adenine phosphoribosyltransferase [Phycisphaerae bacterium]
MAAPNNLDIPDVRSLAMKLRDIKDFPKPGIVFKDVTPLLADSAALSLAVEFLTQPFRDKHIDKVVGAESRGFIFGTAVARNLSAGFVPIRKPGKLPFKTRRMSYELEYGTDSLEIHEDAIRPKERVLMIDDLLATGGTMVACCDLVRQLKGEIVGVAVLIELCFLHGRKKFDGLPVHSVIKIPEEGVKVASDF